MRLTVTAMFLLLASATPQHAAAKDYPSQEWYWNVDGPRFYYAATANSASHMLAQFCYLESGNCLYVITTGSTCEEESRYPALVNTDKGSRSIELVCGKALGKENLFILSDFDQIDTLIRDANQIGIAMPMQGDEFKVVRFGLRGAIQAIDSMRKLAGRDKSEERSGSKPAVERL